jgi:hypothetical protein
VRTAWVRGRFGLSRGSLGRAVPIAKKSLANLGDGYNPFKKVFFDSSVSPQSQPYFHGVQVRLNVRLKGLSPLPLTQSHAVLAEHL